MKTLNTVKKGFYADSVVLMRIARELAKDGVEASLMIGTPSNKALLKDSGLLASEGESARPEDLIIAVKGKKAKAAIELAEKLLSSGLGNPSSLPSEIEGANLVLISVPGAFAAAEARRALERGLHVMMFSDNVSVEDEVALKDLAISKGLLLMGPDCGTALIAGVPLAFANAVPRGDVGIVSASGTGLQEVSTLLARSGKGVSHGIGVGGRDLSEAVGGRMTLAALDALEADPATRRIIVISKPPAASVTKKVLDKVRRLKKPVTLCLLGASGKQFKKTLEEAAGFKSRKTIKVKVKGKIAGLFCGGTLCAEAEIILADQGLPESAYRLIDLGDDEYTRGRPHPMIEPQLRNEHLAKVLKDKSVGVILLDVVIGYGAHADPAGLLAGVFRTFKSKPLIVASVTGTESDPQVYSQQVKTLKDAGVVVAESNAQAARIAASAIARPGKPSPKRRPRQSRPRSRSR